MNGRNVLIGSLQSFRARGAHHDSVAGQRDMDHVLMVVDAYCNEQKQAALAEFSREHFAAIATAIPQIEAGDIDGALLMLRAAAARHVA